MLRPPYDLMCLIFLFTSVLSEDKLKCEMDHWYGVGHKTPNNSVYFYRNTVDRKEGNFLSDFETSNICMTCTRTFEALSPQRLLLRL